MELYRIASSNLLGVRYEPAARQMYILFRSGYCYVYFGVAPELYERLLRAQPHPWSRVGRAVMRHRYRRIARLPLSSSYVPRAA